MKKRILLVEDTDDLRDCYKQTLVERMGFLVVEAENGQDALKKLETEEPFFALVTDLNMPVMSGDELIRKIREKGIPFERVILFSSFIDVDKIAEELNRNQPEEKKIKVVMKGTSVQMWMENLWEALS
jgi:two-component system, OmpR family, alkaline phosphatase synthesis response regulator PhoP